MRNIIVVGTQWGDEGKGKVVDWLSLQADIVVRFQGGNNAGHTLVIDGEVYKLSMLPSGVVRQDKLSILGNGVVIDIVALLAEIDGLAERGIEITPQHLQISENATCILQVHRTVDQAQEMILAGDCVGTTGRGIGPAYEDRIARRAIRICDLFDKQSLAKKIQRLLNHYSPLYHTAGIAMPTSEQMVKDLSDAIVRIVPFVKPVWRTLHDARDANKMVLYEGAQGANLDVDTGTYPFVTSSNTVAAQAAIGSGYGDARHGRVLGITKAYTTRVGAGPMPSELHDEMGQRLGERGFEFGTVTGRKRRCGWFDALLVRQACIVGGVDMIILTKLDVLDGFEKLMICTKYSIDGELYDYLPACAELQARAQPQYEEIDGWSESTEGVRNFDDLPVAARAYVARLEELLDRPIAAISTSPDREDMILRADLLSDR